VEIYHLGKPKYGQATPLKYVIENSQQLHSEIKSLYGYWVAQGKPRLRLDRRNYEYFTLINSILTVNGYQGFDSNRRILNEASSDPDTELLRELYIIWKEEAANSRGIKASEIIPHLSQQVQIRVCGEGSERSQSTMLGRKLGNLVGRDIQIEEEVQRLMLRKKNNASHFFFEQVHQDATASRTTASEAESMEEHEASFDEQELEVANDGDGELKRPYPLGNDINEIFD